MQIKHSKALVICLIIVLISSALSYAEPSVFADLEGHWAESYVSALYEKGGVSGMPDGLFHPNETMTFPQFVTIIISEAFGKQEPVSEHWASGYMKLALEKELINEYDMDNMDDITRFDAARLAFNAVRLILGEEESDDLYSIEDFADFGSCHSCQETYNYARQCRMKGIVQGRPSPDGPVYDGNDNLTRAEGCIIIMKMLEAPLRTPPVSENAS